MPGNIYLSLNPELQERTRGVPGGSVAENPPAKAGATGSIPGLGGPHTPHST